MANNVKSGASKGEYNTPTLSVYGSVRNLTGGSSGTDNDGGGSMKAADAGMGMA